MKRILPVLFLLAAACTGAEPGVDPAARDPGAPAGRSSLERAHDAYLGGDLRGMSLALRDVLSDEAVDEDVRANAFALLEKAYEVGGGQVPADWSLPRGLLRLELTQVRVEQPSGEVGFVTSVMGDIDDPQRMQAIRLSHGGEVVLEKGASREKIERISDEKTFWSYDGPRGSLPLERGVYDLHIELRGAPAVDGWVIVSDLEASAGPRIRAPGPGAVAGGNPTLSFDDFRSPEYRPFERRVVYLGVSPEGGPVAWSLWSDEPGFTEVVVGKDPRGKPETTLAPGRHVLMVSFTETRRFGPVELGRASRKPQPFQVR